MNFKIFYNSRNEAACTDGARWWAGTDSDETTIKLRAMQPASELFPNPDPIVPKARSVFISALRRTAPAVSPGSDAERAVFHKAWDDATAFAAAHCVVRTGIPVFDHALGVIGTADAIVAADAGAEHPYVYVPDGWEYGGEMNALTQILFCGFPIDCADDPFGRYTLRNLSRAIMALLIRDRTPWYVKHMEQMPF